MVVIHKFHQVSLLRRNNPVQFPIVQHKDIHAIQLFQGFQVGALFAGDPQGFQESEQPRVSGSKVFRYALWNEAQAA